MPPDFLYPATPENVPLSITDPSPAFKKEVSGVMGSILFFFIVYALLLLLSVALVIGCVYAGIAIIINVPKLITIAAGIGLVGVGVMVFVFLVKFLFSVSRYDRSHIIEINENEQPALFSFIRQLTKDTQTPFPRKIYVSADVNACVFYDSSFWSMFFPVKKNLQIGLGLVNSLNVSEFKAVMAHEFGHFSQRSMKLGSFVYNVNKIIYNMLFDNKGYASFLQVWANIDGVFAIFASITAGIAKGIQSILRQMYGFINKKYMSLSRQMEFHADAVAASVSGSGPLGTALRRIEMAASCYEITLQKYDDLFRKKMISHNIYPHQKLIIQQMAHQYKLPLQNGLPVISDEFYRNTNSTRVNFKDQWASHPSTEERIKHLDELAIPSGIKEETAWVLFNNKEQLQQQLTKKIYEQVEMPQDITVLDETEFDNTLKQDRVKNNFPDEYNGFYDNRQLAVPENEEEVYRSAEPAENFLEIFTADNAAVSKKINAATHDIEILKAIQEKRIDTKSFDFDGVKYNRSDAPAVMEKLETALKDMKEGQEKLDNRAILFFYTKAKQADPLKAEELKGMYASHFRVRKKADVFLKQMNEMLSALQPVFSGQTITLEEINSMITRLKDKDEPAFKEELKNWMEPDAFVSDPSLKVRVKAFIDADYVYFHDKSFIETELKELHALCNESWVCVNTFLFDQFKAILQMQLKYV
jgi:Zn-dependent protease with chaperone function